MVPFGDTAISLNTPARTKVHGGGGEVVQINSKAKCQDLPKFSFSGEGGIGIVQTNIPEIIEWRHSRNFEPKILEA